MKNSTPMLAPIQVDERNASVYIGTPVATLRNWRSLGKGPKVTRVGRSVRYRVSDLNAWVEALDGEAA